PHRPALRGEHAIDLRIGDAVVPAAGAHRPHGALVDPLFQRGIADAQPFGGLADGYQSHRTNPAFISTRIILNYGEMTRRIAAAAALAAAVLLAAGDEAAAKGGQVLVSAAVSLT